MLQLTNNTPFAADMTVLPNEQGVETLFMTVKASFKLGQDWVLAEPQVPVQAEDVYWGEPGASSLKHATDVHVGKSSTDIIMQGEACAPEGKPVRQLDVRLSVGSLTKTVRVFGDRQWQDGQIVGPQAFTRMPMVWERAYGGKVCKDDQLVAVEVCNPVGVGLPEMGENRWLPNLEDPNDLIQTVKHRPVPTCFAPIAPGWRPRADFAGTYDAKWQETRAPYLPDDFDFRFLNVAATDLIYPGFLQGGEPVAISNMHPTGDLKFTLPQVKLVGRVEMGRRIETPIFNLETLLLEPNRQQVAMTWKARLRCDKQTMNIRQAVVGLSR